MTPARLIQGKNVLVTGGNRGIGLQFVKEFLGKGNKVLATSRNPESSSELQTLAAANPDRLFVAPLDVSSPASIAKLPSLVPFDHVDVAINNAGLLIRKRFGEYTHEDMVDSFVTNSIGPLLLVQELVSKGKIGGKKSSIIGMVTSKMGSIDDNGSGGR